MISLSEKDGFTLIELVLVLALLALAASVTMVSIGRTSKRALIRNEASLLQGTLRQARQASLFERRPVTLGVDADRGAYVLSKGKGLLIQSHDVPAGLTLSGSEEIVFFPKGDSTGGSLKLAGAEGRSYLIEVDRVTGLARLTRL
jgi:general secretion pathway protein H